MQQKKVKYIGFYDTSEYENEKRNTFVAATNKMDYIAEAILKNGIQVDIISPSWTTNKKGFYSKRNTLLSEGISLICGSTFGANTRFLGYLRIIWSWIWLFSYLLKYTKNGERVLVYHSMMLMCPIMLAKKIKKFQLILEAEEIYQDVAEFSSGMKQCEYKFFESADKYIFPTELLNQKLNVNNKPYSIIYGTYRVEEDKKNKFNDGKVHVIYAGTFDPRKGGALAAAAAATYLPKNYHVHIIGFGSKDDTRMLLDKIDEISKLTQATITYDGFLNGEEYIHFLQKCDIGLSTQMPEGAYNETSFPSKILSYMANGLIVVSIRIKAIEISDVGQTVYYYEEPTPEAIANVIKSIDIMEPYDSRALTRSLDEKFVRGIKELIGK